MRRFPLFAVILLLVVACKKNHDQPAPEIFPDKVGDNWLYLVNDTFTTYQSPPVITQYNMMVSVIDSILLPGGVRANIWVYNSPAGNDTNYVFKHNDTITFLARREFFDLFPRQYVIPLGVNNSWEYSWASAHNVTIASRSNINVGPYNFENAFHIIGYPGRPDEIITLDEWFEEHVGVVKRYINSFGTTNPLKHRTSWSLISYHVE
jgi:hypothetical protein